MPGLRLFRAAPAPLRSPPSEREGPTPLGSFFQARRPGRSTRRPATSSARRWRSNGCVRAARVEPAADGVAQQLATLREADRDELAQERRIDVVAHRQRRHAQDRGVDARRRLERLGRHVEQGLDPVAPLQHHREPAVVLVARPRSDPVDHLLLQHEVLVVDGVARLEKVEQDRRRDVVGQVADDAQLSPRRDGGQGREIDVEDVGLDDVEPGRAAQPRGQVAIELDDRERAAALEQRTGQRTPARADLDEGLTASRIDRIDDPVEHRSVDQEVLAEPLPGVLHR